MLLSYGGKNCWSFKEWMEIDFSFNHNVPEKYGFSDVHIAPALCFEGPNASGKSCALRVLSFIMDFCLNSFSYRDDKRIMYDTFFHNEEKSEFYIRFTLSENQDIEYLYETVLDPETVFSEKLTQTENGKKTLLLKRTNSQITENRLFDPSVGIILKNNASLISTLIQYGVKELAPFKEFFSAFISNVAYHGTHSDLLTDYVSRYYYENPDIHRRVIEQLRMYDTGIQDIEILQTADSQGNTVYYSVFHHNTDSEKNGLSYLEQSMGTQILYNRLKDFYMTIDRGGILVFDELDNHLHSAIVPLLLDCFLNEEINQKHAQLIFTSHDASLLDSMRKYRTYLFKREQGESICYRIDELPNNILLRNDRPLEQVYKMGLLGGLPDV